MALGQITINGTQYYYENGTYYRFHIVSNPQDGLFLFAAQDLGINKTSGFSAEEAARINDLTGGLTQQTKYRVLKNGAAVPIQSSIPGRPDIKRDDVILRRVEPVNVPGLVRHSCSSYSLPGPVCSVCQKPFP